MGKILELIRLTWDVIFNRRPNYNINDFEKKSITKQIAEVDKLVKGKTMTDLKKLEKIGYIVFNKPNQSELDKKLSLSTRNGLIKKIINPQLLEYAAKGQLLVSEWIVQDKIETEEEKLRILEKKYPREMNNDNTYKHTKPAIGIEARLKEKDRYDRDILYYNPVFHRAGELRQIANGQTVLHAEVQETMVQETMRRPRQGENETEQEFKTRVTNYEREMEYAKENYKILNNEVKQESKSNIIWNSHRLILIDMKLMIKEYRDEYGAAGVRKYMNSYEYNPNLVPLSLKVKYFYTYGTAQHDYFLSVEEKYQIRSDAAQVNTTVTNSNINVTSSNINATNSNINATNSNTNATNSNTNATNSNINATNSNINATNSNTNVTKINCAIEEQLEMLNSMTLLTLIGIVVIGVLAISISNKSRIFSSVIKGLSLEKKKK